MPIIQHPREPLQLICCRCGRQYPDVEIGDETELRHDARMRGWEHYTWPVLEDVCPPCIGTAPQDAVEPLEIEREMRSAS